MFHRYVLTASSDDPRTGIIETSGVSLVVVFDRMASMIYDKLDPKQPKETWWLQLDVVPMREHVEA